MTAPAASTMRAAVYRRKGAARDVLAVETRPVPAPAAGEVRVKLAYSGVNPSDVKSRAGAAGMAMPFEFVTPHSDGAGVVDAVGSGVTALSAGTPVWVYNGQWNRAQGTAAEYIVLPAAQAVPLPPGTSAEIGASLGIPLLTAFHAIDRCGALLGRTVIVFGAAGAVGHYATQLAALAGARVTAVVSSAEKAAMARAAGAAETIDYRAEDVSKRVAALTQKRGADFVIEVDASANVHRYADILAFGGTAVIYGSGAADIAVPFRPMLGKFATLYFFVVYALPPALLRRTVDGATALLAQGRLRHLPTAVYALDEIAAAHERVEQGANAKVLVKL
jgi:NADPH2:quinone reductase